MRRILVVVILAAVAYAVLDPDAVSELLSDRPQLTVDETRVLAAVLDERFGARGADLGVVEIARGQVDPTEVGRTGAATLDTEAVEEAVASYRRRNEDVGWLPADFGGARDVRILTENEYAPLLAPGGARAVAQAEVGVLTEVGAVVYLARPGFDATRSVAVVSLVNLKAIPPQREWFWLERTEDGWNAVR